MKKTTLMTLALLVSVFAMAQDRIAIPDFSIKGGESKLLEIELINEMAYTAFAMDIILPEGLTVETVLNEDEEEVPGFVLTSRKMSTHGVNLNEIAPGTFRVLANSSNNKNFKGNSGALLNVHLKADETMAAGSHTIKVVNVEFTDDEGTDYPFADLTKDITVIKSYAISVATSDETKGAVTVEGAGAEVDYGTSVTATATAIPGYSFVNWTAGEDTLSTENPYTFTASANIELVANFKVNQYDVIFDVDGVADTTTHDFGTAITKPADPAKEGYTFTGWSPAFTEGATVPVDGITYVAQWQINTYKVVYKVDSVEYKTVEVEYNAAIPSEPAAVKEGHTFGGWSEVPATMPANDIEVTGSFTVNQYAVIFDVDGVADTTSLDFGTAITKPADPAKEGYTFTGWSPAFAEGATVPVDGITYVAQWQINTYKIVYKVDSVEYKTVEVEYNVAIPSEPAAVKEGHTFSGWSEVPATMPANDIEVTGSFTVNTYKAVFKVEGQDDVVIELAYGSEITAPAYADKEGYTFAWGEVPATMPANDIEVTGTYTVNSYKVTYIVDDEEYKSVDVVFGDTIPTMEEPTKEGYLFSGWSEIPATMPAEDITITGSFVVDAIYGVTVDTKVDVYNLNGVKVAGKIAVKDLDTELEKGIYIINGKKYWVK